MSLQLQKHKALSTDQKIEILNIWNSEYPDHLRHNSLEGLENYLNKLEQEDHYLAFNSSGKLIGWLVTFNRQDERWFAMIIHNSTQRTGLGSKLLGEAKKHESSLNGWAIDHNRDVKNNGEVYPSPISFYLKNGFKILPEERLEIDRLSSVKIRWRST